MLKNAKIGDKVYSINNGYIDLEVIDINDRKITCKGKYLIENYESIQFKEVQRVFLDIELFKENIVTDEVLTKIPKWKKITNITYNMTLPLKYLYDYYLNGELDLNPFYQRGLVWSYEQKIEYIKAIFERQIEITPTIIVNYALEENKHLKRYEVLDGKQRISTLFELIENKLILWNNKRFNDLSIEDKKNILYRNLKYTNIEKNKIDNEDNLTDKEKIELFLEINALGTKMSDEHIKKLKEQFL